ncbi:MAG TPA: von Willebrand factor type A domain-containing protein, partial [Candidatus Limnocylindrales bacterium]|nr:von Willebrand factor type A domain-containing protein [Candidatus Limnocylindrales bacterium]
WQEAPSSAPYPDPVDFQDVGVNPFVDPTRDPFSTFAMDVDTASYAVTRRFLEDGNMPDRDSVRLEEFVNSFNYDYRSPQDSAFAIHVEGAPAPFVDSRSILLRIGIQARELNEFSRKPVALTFVIDTSGSMDMENRLELVKAALGLLVDRLSPDDSVAIVRFGDDAEVVLPPTSAAEPEQIRRAIADLHTGGSTNVQAGLELGYDMAALGHRSGATDRVVLASDGVANVGLTNADEILRRIDREVDAGVELVSVGVGMGNFNDVLLEQLADRGNGFYAYINDRLEAERLFGEELIGTLQTVARDARVQVEFHPDAVLRYRLLGYENRRMADGDFENPYVDAGEVGAGHSVTALYEIEPSFSRDAFLGSVRVRWVDPDTNAEQEEAVDIDLFSISDDYRSTSPGFQLAATVGGFAEILRESPYVNGYTLDDIAREAASLSALFENDLDVSVFRELTEIAARLDRGFDF